MFKVKECKACGQGFNADNQAVGQPVPNTAHCPNGVHEGPFEYIPVAPAAVGCYVVGKDGTFFYSIDRNTTFEEVLGAVIAATFRIVELAVKGTVVRAQYKRNNITQIEDIDCEEKFLKFFKKASTSDLSDLVLFARIPLTLVKTKTNTTRCLIPAEPVPNVIIWLSYKDGMDHHFQEILNMAAKEHYSDYEFRLIDKLSNSKQCDARTFVLCADHVYSEGVSYILVYPPRQYSAMIISDLVDKVKWNEQPLDPVVLAKLRKSEETDIFETPQVQVPPQEFDDSFAVVLAQLNCIRNLVVDPEKIDMESNRRLIIDQFLLAAGNLVNNHLPKHAALTLTTEDNFEVGAKSHRVGNGPLDYNFSFRSVSTSAAASGPSAPSSGPSAPAASASVFSGPSGPSAASLAAAAYGPFGPSGVITGVESWSMVTHQVQDLAQGEEQGEQQEEACGAGSSFEAKTTLNVEEKMVASLCQLFGQMYDLHEQVGHKRKRDETGTSVVKGVLTSGQEWFFFSLAKPTGIKSVAELRYHKYLKMDVFTKLGSRESGRQFSAADGIDAAQARALLKYLCVYLSSQ